ncbi:MAG: HD domain-containing protein [Clostridia bacterium]|nr:HD domain-containing protein [Clostridia bacterium]
MIQLPPNVERILTLLNRAGYKAYVVGGCVRDALLSKAPKDWDICTSALPDEMERVFQDFRVVETGLKHGTLTVVLDGVPYEITTFRVDGAYTDHRHPDGVTFVTDVREDLARRDFTVNAMAYHPAEGLIDAFGGREDLRRKVIRCVGQPEERFREDALRILRALRFASVYGFTIDEETAEAAHALKETLSLVAAERIRAELGKMLCGQGCGDILRTDRDILGQILPQLTPMFDFPQCSPYHRFDVWEHTVRSVENVPATEVLRFTMLLHDAGKPATFTWDETGVGHFYGHAACSEKIAEAVMTRLRMDKATAQRVMLLVKHHDINLTTDSRLLKRRLNQFGEEALRQLIDVQEADQLAKGTCDPAEIRASAAALRQALDELLASAPCFTLKDLAVNGRDIAALGAKGSAIGDVLQHLLSCVMDDILPNEKDPLLQEAKRMVDRL